MTEKIAFGLVYQATEIVTDDLTDPELANLIMCLTIDNDPRTLACWNKVRPLFVAMNPDFTPSMHELTRNALNIIYSERLG